MIYIDDGWEVSGVYKFPTCLGVLADARSFSSSKIISPFFSISYIFFSTVHRCKVSKEGGGGVNIPFTFLSSGCF